MKKKVVGIFILALIFGLSGCALFGPPASQHEAFVFTYEEAGFHLQLAREILTSLNQSGTLVGDQYEKAKNTYNTAVDIYWAAGKAYKKYLTAPDVPTANTFRDQYRKIMLELTKMLLEINNQLKGGAV